MTEKMSLRDLADLTGGIVRGDGNRQVAGASAIGEYHGCRLSFVGSEELARSVPADVAVLSTADHFPEGHDGVEVADFRRAMALVLERFAPHFDESAGVSPLASVSPEAFVASDATVGPFCVVEAGARVESEACLVAQVYLGHGAVVGERTVIEPHAVVHRLCRVGRECLIHSGAVIGADGFGVIPGGPDGRNMKIPQIGSVVLGDRVEIGASVCIDRGAIGDTVIGDDTKMDNQVQVGHNCQIGKNCIITSQTGVSGSVVLEDGVILAARSGIQDHRRIGRGAVVAALSGVTKDVKPGAVVSGFPAMDHKEHWKIQASMRRLPEMVSRLKALEKRLEE